MHVAILTRQIGHYHNARYCGAAEAIDRVTVISTANQGGFAEFLAKNTGEYNIERLFPDREHYDAALAKGGVRNAVMSCLDRIKPDVVAVLGWAMPESLAALTWATQTRTPAVMLSETQSDDGPRSFLKEAVKRRFVGLCQAALVGGPPQADYIKALSIPDDAVFFGYNAVDNHHFATGAAQARKHEAKRRADLDLPDRYILASARFIAKKNLPGLVRSYADARKQVADAPDLVILGDGDEKGAVESAITETDLAENIHLPGYRGYEDLPALYGLSEGFAHVSTREQWGLVINEAMASGVPVVVSDRCGASRTIVEHNVSGWLVDPFSHTDMTQALVSLFSKSPEERQVIGQLAHDHAAEWGPARFGSGLRKAAEKALETGNSQKAGFLTRMMLHHFSSAPITSPID